jgi:hypothetical protein
MYLRLTRKGEISSPIFLESRNSKYSFTKMSLVYDLIFFVSSMALSNSLSLENNFDLIKSLTSFS